MPILVPTIPDFPRRDGIELKKSRSRRQSRLAMEKVMGPLPYGNDAIRTLRSFPLHSSMMGPGPSQGLVSSTFKQAENPEKLPNNPNLPPPRPVAGKMPPIGPSIMSAQQTREALAVPRGPSNQKRFKPKVQPSPFRTPRTSLVFGTPRRAKTAVAGYPTAPPPSAALKSSNNRPEFPKDKKESFAEFSRRINTLTSNNWDLDDDLHASFVQLSLGKQPEKSAFNWGPGTKRRDMGPKLSIVINKDLKSEDNLKPYEATFAEGEKRSSGSDDDAFRPADRYWKSKTRSKGEKKDKHYRSRKHLIPSSVITQKLQTREQTTLSTPSSSEEEKYGKLKPNLKEEARVVFRETSRRLLESANLREKSSLNKIDTPRPTTELEYIPLKARGTTTNIRLNLLKKIEDIREKVRSNGYVFKEDDPTEQDKEIWNHVKKNKNNGDKKRVEFGETKLSSIIGKNVAESQGRRVKLTDDDNMKPLAKKMLEGMEDYGISHFLPEGPGHKSPSVKEPPRPILKQSSTAVKEEIERVKLTSGKGHMSLVEALNNYDVSASDSGTRRPGESRVTQYLEDVRIHGLPESSKFKQNLPNQKAKSQNPIKFLRDRENSIGFDESLLDEFNMSKEKREDFIELLKDKRLRQIHLKAGLSGVRGIPFPQALHG